LPPFCSAGGVMNAKRILLCATAVVLAVSPAQAALKVGDPAPKLQVSRWVQGGPVDSFQGDKVYIVEFWATWCGPCIQAIPHINALYEKHKDKGLVVIGQNVWERKPEDVPGFVSRMSGKMTYPVALDDTSGGGDGFMAANWLKAAGQNGIPCAFVINKKGEVAYIGHPMKLDDALIGRLLDEPSTKPAAAPAASAGPASPGPKATALVQAAQQKILAGELDAAQALLTELHAELHPKFQYIGGLLELNLLVARGKTADAVALAKLLVEDFPDRPEIANPAAALLVSMPKPEAKLLETAETIASPLASRSGPAQGMAQTTLARIAHLRGDHAKAVEWQQRALDVLPPAAAAEARKTLDSYRKAAETP
jgi:thiol-disulfide isomerase/thioredoxin